MNPINTPYTNSELLKINRELSGIISKYYWEEEDEKEEREEEEKKQNIFQE